MNSIRGIPPPAFAGVVLVLILAGMAFAVILGSLLLWLLSMVFGFIEYSLWHGFLFGIVVMIVVALFAAVVKVVQ